jgi:hypothetical protein
MSNPTTPFSWQMPTATDLVTDLPADFEVFGQAVATSMADLLGGTSGQILAKNSNTDMDFVWIANDQGDITGITASSPLTGGGTSGAITVGIQDGTTAQKGAVQLENSTSSTSTTTAAVPASVKSAYDLADGAIAKSTVTTAGDIIYRNATVPTRLGIGTAGQVLTVNTGATAPEWKTPAGASTFVGAFASSRASQSIANATFTAIALGTQAYATNSIHSTGTNNSRFTIPSGKGGYWLFYQVLGFDPLSSGNMNIRFYKNNTSTIGGIVYTGSTSASTLTTASNISILSLSAGDYIEMVVYQNSGGSANILISGGEDFAYMGCQYLGA